MRTNWQYTSARRVVLQITLWAAFAGTVGLAAFVDYDLAQVQRHLLTEPITDGPLTFALPRGWKISARSTPGISIHTAVDSASGSTRSVTIQRQRVDHMMLPFEYLQLSGQLVGKQVIPSSDEIAGFPGESVKAITPATGIGAQGESQSLISCIVIPTSGPSGASLQAITMRLEKAGAIDETDERLADLLEESLKISGGMEPAGGKLELAGGIKVSLPSDFRAFGQPDALATERVIFDELSGGRCVTATLIPVMVPLERGQDFMTQALASRQADTRQFAPLGWLKATVSQESENCLKMEPQQTLEDRAVAEVAYLLGKPGSKGVLVWLRAAVPAGDDDLDAAWTKLSTAFQFTQAVDLKSLLAAGQIAASRAQFAPPHPASTGDQWSLWLQSSGGKNSDWIDGWTRDYQSLDSHILRRQTKRHNWDGSITEVMQRWGLFPGDALSIDVTRSDAQADSNFLVLRFHSVSHVTDSLETDIVGLPRVGSPLPQAFVFSASLPRFLGTIGPKPLAIWTDHFTGLEGDLLPYPVLILLERKDPFVQAEVNGSGQLSRWFFKPDGSLDHAEFPGGLSLEPSSGTFTQPLSDPRLTPTP